MTEIVARAQAVIDGDEITIRRVEYDLALSLDTLSVALCKLADLHAG